jgi:hypothetical protein
MPINNSGSKKRIVPPSPSIKDKPQIGERRNYTRNIDTTPIPGTKPKDPKKQS